VSNSDEESETDAPAQTRITAENVRITRREKEKDRCDHLACPPLVPGLKYRGGAHYYTKMPVGDELDSHHMPVQGYGNMFPSKFDPAIQMKPEDHWKTASHPKSRELRKNYNRQTALLQEGQNYEVFKLDVLNVLDVEKRITQPGKYAAAVAQSAAYMECLK